MRLGWTFSAATIRYWLVVFPSTSRELRRLRRAAARIPDASLRHSAREALAKRGNLEGAAAFVVLAPWRRSRAVLRALLAFQAIYNHVDLLAERPGAHAVARARRLHSALLAALDPERAPEDHYALCDRRDDGGYLEALVERCRAALAELPSYPTAAVRAQACAARIVCFQSLSQGPSQELERWARSQTGGVPLAWWELAAAAGSSLAVHALIAAAGAPTLDPARVDAIEGAYFTPIGALHSLLDSVVDREEDMATGQPSLIAGYRDPRAAAAGLGRLARASRTAAMALDRGPLHESLVAAMACHYLATLGPEMDELVRPVRAGVGPIATPAMLVFRAQASLRRCTTSRLTFPRRRQAAAASPLGEKRGIDARAA